MIENKFPFANSTWVVVVVVAVMVVAIGLSGLVGTQEQKRDPSWELLLENPREAKAIPSGQVTGNRASNSFQSF